MMTDDERKKIKAILDTAIGDFLLHASASLPSALDHMDEQDREIERLRAALEHIGRETTDQWVMRAIRMALKGGGDD